MAGEKSLQITDALNKLVQSFAKASGGKDTPDVPRGLDPYATAHVREQVRRFEKVAETGLSDADLDALVAATLRSIDAPSPTGKATGGGATGLVCFIAALVGLAKHGWPGAATSFLAAITIATGLHAVFRTNLAKTSGIVSMRGRTGVLQTVTGLLIVAGGGWGAFYGGWTWGWIWSPALGIAGLVVGSLIGLIASLAQAHEREHNGG